MLENNLLAAVIKYIEKNPGELLNGLLFLIIPFYFWIFSPVSFENIHTVFLFQRIDQVNLPTEMSKIREETWARHAILLAVRINHSCIFKTILSYLVFNELCNFHCSGEHTCQTPCFLKLHPESLCLLTEAQFSDLSSTKPIWQGVLRFCNQ